MNKFQLLNDGEAAVILIKPVTDERRASQTPPFRWWFLLYLVVQNALIITGLDWLLSQLFSGRWPVFTTYFFVILFIVLTVLGYATATNANWQKKKPHPEFELMLDKKGVTLKHFAQPADEIPWKDISLVEWFESNQPPAVMLRLYPNSPTHRTRTGADRPPFVYFELIGFELPPVEIFEKLDYYWRNPKARAEL